MMPAASLTGQDWLGWSLAMILGYPLAVVVLNEVLHRLQERGRPLGAPVRHLRNVTLPLLALVVFLEKMLGLPPQNIGVKVASTLLLLSLFLALLSFGNVLLFAEARVTSWRARVPKLFLDLSRVFFLAIGLAMVLALVWEADLKGFLAALGIGSLVIGLALQDTLGNLFSGIALLFERPFAIGDFIRVGAQEGQVVEMTWRTTRIRLAGTDAILVIPNLALGRQEVVNLTPPGRPAVRVPVSFSYDDPPNRVKQIVREVAESVPGVLVDPPPTVLATAYGDAYITYDVALSVADYSARLEARDEFLTRVWYAAKRHGLNIHRALNPAAEAAAAPERLRRDLAALPALRALPEEELREVCQRSSLRRFGRDELVLREGDRSPMLHLVLEGELLVSTHDEHGVEREVGRLAPGEFVGVGHTLSGEPSAVNARAATDAVLMAIPPDVASRMLDRFPRLVRDLGAAQEARRQAAVQAKQGLTAPINHRGA